MSTRPPTEVSLNNPRTPDLACSHCAGVIAHEDWCVTSNAIVRYAYEAVLAGRLNLGDELSLHALGVKWIREFVRIPG